MKAQKKPDWTRYALLIWWLAFFALKFYAGGDSASVDSGNVSRQILVIIFAILGICHLRKAFRRLRPAVGVWVAFGIAYLIWSYASLAWSSEFDLSVRRIIQFTALLIGWIGLGAGYYGGAEGPGRLAKDVFLGAIAMLILASPVLVSDLTISNLLNPLWEPNARNLSTDMPCAAAFGLVATIVPIYGTRRYLLYAPWAAALILIFLIVYKSRSILAFAVLIFLYLYTSTLKSDRLRGSLRISGVVLFVLSFSLNSLGEMLGGRVGEFLARGNNERGMMELNGRIPLWNYVWTDVQANWWIGTGFGAYWSDARLGLVFRSQGWHAPVAHNGYLDEWVHTGLIGLILILCFVFTACSRTLSISRRVFAASLAIPWIAFFLMLNIFDSYLQSWFRIPPMVVLPMLFSCLSAGVPKEYVASR